jgi:hypothetical protein
MQCQFGGVWLTGLPWQEGIAEAEWSYELESDVVSIIGATEPLMRSFGNARDELSFSVTREFNTQQLAAEYCIDRPWALPTKSNLVLTEGTMTRTYANALLTGHTRTRHGVSVAENYTFLLGTPT